MRDTDTGNVGHIWVPHKHLFGLSRVEVDPTRDDHVRYTVVDVDVAVFVHVTNLAEGEDSRLEVCCGRPPRIVGIYNTAAS